MWNEIRHFLFLGILLERRKFYIFLQYEFFSFCFVFCYLFIYFCPLCIHTYIYEFSCWLLFKAHRLVNEHDTKDSNELKEDHNINYSVGFGVWAEFRDNFLMHRKLLNSNCSIAYSFLGNGWRENLWAPIQCWSIGLYVWLVSYFLFDFFFYSSIFNVLCMGLDFVFSHFVCKKWHELGNFYWNLQILKCKFIWSQSCIKFSYMVCLCIW